MLIPFRNELNDVFLSGRSIWLKIAASAAATGFIGVFGLLRFASRDQGNLQLTAPMIVLVGAASAAVGAFLALGLSLKDVVQRRIAEEKPVNPVLRLYFGRGSWSLFAWFVTVIFGTIVVAMITSV